MSCVVRSLPGRLRLTLFLPDCGDEHELHYYSRLHYISELFIRRSALANECHFVGITPLKKKWHFCETLKKKKKNVDTPKSPPKNLNQIKAQQSSEAEDDELNAKDRLEVKLLNYQSPSLMYVLMECQREVFLELHCNMHTYYMKRGEEGVEGGRSL